MKKNHGRSAADACLRATFIRGGMGHHPYPSRSRSTRSSATDSSPQPRTRRPHRVRREMFRLMAASMPPGTDSAGTSLVPTAGRHSRAGKKGVPQRASGGIEQRPTAGGERRHPLCRLESFPQVRAQVVARAPGNSQAQGANSILVTRSTTEALVNDWGLLVCRPTAPARSVTRRRQSVSDRPLLSPEAYDRRRQG